MQIVIPGFNDAHIHLGAQLTEKWHIDAKKYGANTKNEILKQHAKTHRAVIVTNYCHNKHNSIHNTLAPILLISPCWHEAYCNELFCCMHKNINVEFISDNLYRLTQMQVVAAYNASYPVKFKIKDLV